MITCAFEDGGKAELRHVVTDSLIIRDNEILLVKRAPHLIEGGKYGLPGGYMDRDENVKECVVREILEETGWEVELKEFFAVLDNPNRGDDRQNVGFVFVSSPVKLVGEPDKESSHVGWFSFDSLPKPLAFDHQQIIDTYLEHVKNPKMLPVFLS